jgi:type VI secretion system protein ImpL
VIRFKWPSTWPAFKWRAIRWTHVATALLGLWAAGLLVAAVQLGAWNQELVRTLLQIRADTAFRQRMAELHETIPRDWYRSKALGLLAASEKLQDDTHWMVFVPGSWRPFDDLRDRLAIRIEREFSEIAVETVRRELFHRASRLTGVAQDKASAELLVGGGCGLPPAPSGLDASAKALQQLPEFVAVQSHLEGIDQLDQALNAMVALQEPSAADAENLRVLVQYTLGAELPGRLSRGAVYFRNGLRPADPGYAAVGFAHVKYAARCSLAKAMAALDARLFERNDLLAAETYLAQRASRFFAPGARPQPSADTVQGLHEVVAALNQQEALLAHRDYAWLQQGTPSLGPAHEGLLARVAAIGLLGPDAVEQVRRRSSQALQPFRDQFARTFSTGGEPALVWLPDRGRLALSPQRLALRDGLVALLQEPFMAPAAGRPFPQSVVSPLSWDVQRLEQVLALSDTRRRFVAESLPKFPQGVQGSISQIVNTQLAQTVQDATLEAMVPGGGGEAPASFDPAAYRTQRAQLAKVQALLAELGARGRGERLRSLLGQDLVDRLAVAEQALWHTPLYSARTHDFSWWQGEGSPILQAFGVADSLTLRHVLAQQFGQLQEYVGQAGALLAYADAAIAANPTVARWRGMLPELEQYHAGRADSSLLALERYLVALGPELNRANCVDRLSAAPAPAGADEFAQRHAHIHRALLARCAELRPGFGIVR